MYTKSILLLALSTASMVSAHGKILAVTGDAGGNGTALGIKGASVATFGTNSATEKDTTVFGGNANKPMTDGLGKTAASGKLTMAMLSEAVAQSGTTLPQVSASGGSINGTWRIVTSDGTANNKAGDLFAVVDPTGTGAYSKGTQLTVSTSMVGNGKGNVVQRAVASALRAVGIQRRATNVGADAGFSVKIPAGTTCTGSDATTGMKNVCLLKVANNNNNGPFGGNVAFQIAGTSTAAANTTAKREESFQA
ncbi:hypothetical protein BP6252_07482 [Coleophoma cylindrospora]|uniref:Cell surface protein n=1 Tax=Coleophoma cylindrospora TaxID=1849047 RepID=A0A3D8RHP7_9HELO|nr:hypothetical protein BP6252_07482 [Coleophoma cylindrospora]